MVFMLYCQEAQDQGSIDKPRLDKFIRFYAITNNNILKKKKKFAGKKIYPFLSFFFFFFLSLSLLFSFAYETNKRKEYFLKNTPTKELSNKRKFVFQQITTS